MIGSKELATDRWPSSRHRERSLGTHDRHHHRVEGLPQGNGGGRAAALEQEKKEGEKRSWPQQGIIADYGGMGEV